MNRNGFYKEEIKIHPHKSALIADHKAKSNKLAMSKVERPVLSVIEGWPFM